MSIDKVLRFFQPKDKTFYPLFGKAADNNVRISELLLHCVKETDVVKIYGDEIKSRNAD